MNAESRLRELVAAHLSDNHTVDGIQFIDHLLSLTFEVGEIECSLADEGKLRFRIPTQPVCEVELERAKAKLRLLCARLGVLCHESGDPDVSLYGGQGRIKKEMSVPTSATDIALAPRLGALTQSRSPEWRVRFKNTSSEQEFTIQRTAR